MVELALETRGCGKSCNILLFMEILGFAKNPIDEIVNYFLIIPQT
jgi:hypothetical protein